jgi:hypothetical protein
MAAEAIALRYLFYYEMPAAFLTDPTITFSQANQLPFRHNALHDIESAWWVGVWMLFVYKPRGHNESNDQSQLRRTRKLYIFPGTLDHGPRSFCLTWLGEFMNSTRDWIADDLLTAAKAFEQVRILLVDYYRDLEKTFPNGYHEMSKPANPKSGAAFPGGPKEDIYEPMKDVLLYVMEYYQRQNTELEPCNRPPQVTAPQM